MLRPPTSKKVVAGMAELADAEISQVSELRLVRVRPPPPAPTAPLNGGQLESRFKRLVISRLRVSPRQESRGWVRPASVFCWTSPLSPSPFHEMGLEELCRTVMTAPGAGCANRSLANGTTVRQLLRTYRSHSHPAHLARIGMTRDRIPTVSAAGDHLDSYTLPGLVSQLRQRGGRNPSFLVDPYSLM